MVPVLSRAQMRGLDTYAIEQCGVPSIVLMENAGRGATDVLVRELLSGEARGARVVVLAGTGNNGGDGFVVARHLLTRGADPIVVVVGDERRLSPDAAANLAAWRGLGGPARAVTPDEDVAWVPEALRGARVVVDALFGTGLDRPIAGWFAQIVRALNASAVARFAVDLPSGLDADTGAPLGVAIEARVTATFAHPKLGLLTPQGAKIAGRVHVVDIGVPASLAGQVGDCPRLLEESDLVAWVSPRAPGAHKNVAGHVVVFGGSAGRVGAPQLAARGAMRGGAGLVTIGTWPEAAGAIDGHTLEVMTARIAGTPAAPSLDAILAGKQAAVVGPGLGLGEDARAVVEHVIQSFKGPIVVDADALTLLAGRTNVLAPAKGAILTPHPGELARILGVSAADVEADRYRAVRSAVKATACVVVLKGAYTLVASPDGRIAVSPVACPALATAGSGDVLGGVIAAQAAGRPAFDAACAGVFLHALSGRDWSQARGGADRGMLASEIADGLPTVISRIASRETRSC
jgi:NAD(P)H-hydrate epimerase